MISGPQFMWLLMWSIFLPIPAFYCGFASEVLWQPVYLCMMFMVMWVDGFLPVPWPQIPARWMRDRLKGEN